MRLIKRTLIDLNQGGAVTETSRALAARYNATGKNYTPKHKGERSGVLEVYEVEEHEKNQDTECDQDRVHRNF